MENKPSQPAAGPPPSKLYAWLQLIRVPNLLTVPGDVIAGWLLANGTVAKPDARAAALIAAGLCFYAAGLVHNDISDLETDLKERPSRPLPSGRIGKQVAQNVFSGLLVAALLLCASAGGDAFQNGIFLMVAIIAYNQTAKRHRIAGPWVMGLCRGLNLLLGASTTGIFPGRVWICAGIEIVYIARVTSLARNETAGGKITPKIIGSLISLLIPLQAAFCFFSDAGSTGWICGGILLTLWPLNRWLGRRFYAS